LEGVLTAIHQTLAAFNGAYFYGEGGEKGEEKGGEEGGRQGRRRGEWRGGERREGGTAPLPNNLA